MHRLVLAAPLVRAALAAAQVAPYAVNPAYDTAIPTDTIFAGGAAP